MSDYVIIAGTPLIREPAVYRTAQWRTQTATGRRSKTEPQRSGHVSSGNWAL